MIRYSIVTLCILFCTIHTMAQSRVGIQVGGHSSNVLEKNDLPDWEETKGYYKGRTGIHIGVTADLPFSEKSRFFFQPGVVFTQKGRKFNQLFDTTISDVANIRSKQLLNYFDIPLNIVYKLPMGKKSRFIIGAGPYASFFFNGRHERETFAKNGAYVKEEDKDLDVGNEPDSYKIFDFGFNALAGFEFGRVFLTANYSQGLNKFFKPRDYTASQYNHQVIGATLGLYLGNIDKTEKDTDKDGVPDSQDKCPDAPGKPEFAGCPDSDNDGLPDHEDACPLEAGPAANHGCPYADTDKDGVLDKDDKCPSVPGPKENNGCPWPDTDNDGILDKDDACPTVAGISRYKGCPVPDSDGDGVNDEEDKCPQVAGLKELQGCPAIAPEKKEEIVKKLTFVAKKIQFTKNQAVLTSNSTVVLDEVVEILNQNPSVHLQIDGHSSDEGQREVNMRLSQQRADAVKDYITAKGISPERLNSKGFGPDKPLNPAKTDKARQQNRRVEITISN
jgi:OOP family OmpA-OmpF porin